MDCNFTTNKILFDYFSFTIKDVEPEDIISMLGLDGVTFIDSYGPKGYHHRYYYDGVSIMYGGRDHVWCEMSGQGCRVYESYGNNDWFGLAYQILCNENAQMTRLDVAYDDFNGLLDIDKITDDVVNGHWVSRCEKILLEQEYTRSDRCGHTIMCGKRGSNISCRIYNKAQERNRSDEIEHWVRCELQIRHKHADDFFIIYLLMTLILFMVLISIMIAVLNLCILLYLIILYVLLMLIVIMIAICGESLYLIIGKNL